MKKIILLAVLFMYASILNAKNVLVISDIDDTIKRTYAMGNYQGGPFFKNEFGGMGNLYRILICKGVEDYRDRLECLRDPHDKDIKNHEINYVTAAPRYLSYFGRKFLEENKYPTGEFYNRPEFGMPTLDYKVNEISEILDKYDPKVELNVILIGDNGSMDTVVYDLIREKYKGTKFSFTTYIHLVYAYSGNYDNTGKILEKLQIPYLTAMDIAISFYNKRLITQRDIMNIYSELKQYLYSEDDGEIKKVIPKWMRCHEYFRDFELPRVWDPFVQIYVNKYHRVLKAICDERAENL